MSQNDRLNILVTGANGQLGTSIRKVSKNSRDKYFFTDVEDLDITDKKAVEDFVVSNEIDVIVNCAAFTNVDAAEDNEDLAEKLNGDAPAILAEAAKMRKGTLIHISTDYVFGGRKNNLPLKEDDETNPTGVYGRTKLSGEHKITATDAKALIIRTAWLYSEYGKNFAKTMLSLMPAKQTIKVVFDQCGTPTYAGDLAEAIVGVIDTRQFEGNEGIYHFSNEGVCSWFDFSTAIGRIAGISGCEVLPCHSSEFPSKVVRPAYSVLDKTKFKETFGRKIPHWEESLEICLKNM